MTKVISISDESYDELMKLKRNLSFTKIIMELVKEKRKDELMKFAGIWTKDEAEKIKKQIYEERKISSKRFV